MSSRGISDLILGRLGDLTDYTTNASGWTLQNSVQVFSKGDTAHRIQQTRTIFFRNARSRKPAITPQNLDIDISESFLQTHQIPPDDRLYI